VKSHKVATSAATGESRPIDGGDRGPGKLVYGAERRAMLAESDWFSSGVRPVIERRLPRSMPEQNAFPAPVTIRIWAED